MIEWKKWVEIKNSNNSNNSNKNEEELKKSPRERQVQPTNPIGSWSRIEIASKFDQFPASFFIAQPMTSVTFYGTVPVL